MACRKHLASTPILRLGHPQAFAAFLKTLGTPTDRLFRQIGLPVYCDDPGAFVPLKQAWTLFDVAARLEDPFVGWHVGKFYGDNGLGAGLLLRIEHAPTLYQALKRLAALVSAEASHLELGIVERRRDILFYTRYSTIKDWPGYSSSQAYQLAVYVDVIRHYAGPEWLPPEIGFEYPAVPRVVEEHFPGARILPGQPMGYLAIPRSCLHMPALKGSQSKKADDAVVLTRKFDLVDTLDTLLAPHLSEGYPSETLAATLLDTSSRTLARRLSESGAGYQTVVDNLRYKKAKKLLSETDMRIIDVAGAIGFRDPANFSRMFRRIAGTTPRAFRRAAQVV